MREGGEPGQIRRDQRVQCPSVGPVRRLFWFQMDFGLAGDNMFYFCFLWLTWESELISFQRFCSKKSVRFSVFFVSMLPINIPRHPGLLSPTFVSFAHFPQRLEHLFNKNL